MPKTKRFKRVHTEKKLKIYLGEITAKQLKRYKKNPKRFLEAHGVKVGDTRVRTHMIRGRIY